MAGVLFLLGCVSHFSGMLSHMACGFSHLDGLVSHMACRLSHLGGVLSHMDGAFSHIRCVLSHMACGFSHLDRLVSHMTCRLSHMTCGLSHIGWGFSHLDGVRALIWTAGSLKSGETLSFYSRVISSFTSWLFILYSFPLLFIFSSTIFGCGGRDKAPLL